MERRNDLAKYIDHTLLKPDATTLQIKALCNEALSFGFASVCVNPCHIKLVSEWLRDSEVIPCCVVGFPLGAVTTENKAAEAAEAIRNGAGEIDMVINIGAAKEGDWPKVQSDIAAVAAVCSRKAKLKVIIETCLLTDEEKIQACIAAKNAGADFVKTSTGFSSGGAAPQDIVLMRKAVGSDMGIKASGGIRTKEDALKMIEAGADRLGTSSGIAIVS